MDRPSGVGFFPTAANPLLQMHLVAGLATMARFGLDQVVYVVAREVPPSRR